MSKIVFFSIPAYGHTNPTIEVVKRLTERGNEVLYYSFRPFEGKIRNAGADFIACDDYLMELKKEDEHRIGTDFSFFVKMLTDTTLAMDEKICRRLKEYSPDCVVADSMCIWGKLFALKLGIPYICSTTTFAFNRYSARIMPQSLPQMLGMITGIRKMNGYMKQLHKHGYPVKKLMDLLQNDPLVTTIVYTSALFQPFSETFPEDRFFFIGPSVEHTPAVKENRTAKRLYISLGTVNNKMKNFYQNCIRAFENSGTEVVMSVGEQTDIKELGPIPSNFTVAKYVKQTEVLQNVDAFLSHCGMNSVNESLYYGVPLILFPQQREQGGVARRAAQLGAGKFLEKNNVDNIRETVAEVLSNPSYREKALILSNDFHHCGGPDMAADVIEHTVLKSPMPVKSYSFQS